MSIEHRGDRPSVFRTFKRRNGITIIYDPDDPDQWLSGYSATLDRMR